MRLAPPVRKHPSAQKTRPKSSTGLLAPVAFERIASGYTGSPFASRRTPRPMQRVDALIRPRWTIRVEPQVRVEEQLAVAIDDGRIVACCPSTRRIGLSPRTRGTSGRGTFCCRGSSTRTRTRRRACSAGSPTTCRSARALERIWPSKARWARHRARRRRHAPRDRRNAAAAGSPASPTCTSTPMSSRKRAIESGIRAVLGMIVLDSPSAWARDAREYRQRARAPRPIQGRPARRYRVRAVVAEHATDATLARIRQLADELDVTVHMQVHETDVEIGASIARFGLRPLARLQKHGLVTPSLLGAHVNLLDAAEIDAARERGRERRPLPARRISSSRSAPAP